MMDEANDFPETGRPNLRRAIDELPQRTPDDARLWPAISELLHANAALARAAAHLPLHAPDDALWGRIEQQLNAENAVARAVPQLPLAEPDDSLWDAITARLDAADSGPLATLPPEPAPAPEEAVVRRLQPAAPAWRGIMALAAALALLVLAWRLLPLGPGGSNSASAPTARRETVHYSEETVAAPLPEAAPLPDEYRTEREGLAFIDAQCNSLPVACQSSEFRELRGQLAELEAEERRVQADLQRLGHDPELVRQQVRVATLKATVTKELVQLIIS